MEEIVKDWIEKVYMREKQYGHGQSAVYSMNQCFAVVTFAIDCLNCNKDLFKWWSREMLPKFKELKHNYLTRENEV